VERANTIQIQLNGEPHDLVADTRVTELLTQMQLTEGRVAIELNRDILPRARWSETRLQEGDRLEIVHFVGGG
jgi:thiamine biosynthesis protein ThiS